MKDILHKRKKINFIFVALFSIFLFLVSLNQTALANTGENIVIFAVEPENQLSKGSGYFDLKVKPGDKQTLDLEIQNHGKKDTEVDIEINPAGTTSDGAFDYSRNDQVDKSLKISLADIATTKKRLKVKAGEKEIAKIELTIPEEGFKGMILGGVRVTEIEQAEKEKKEKEEEKKGKFNIQHKIANIVAIQLIQDEKMPKGDLTLQGVEAGQISGRNVVNVTLQNPQPIIMNKMTYTAQIFKGEETSPLHEEKVKDYRLAPNSQFLWSIDWEDKRFKAGTYRLQMTAENKETKQDWSFDQKFVLSEEEALKLNESAISVQENKRISVVIGIIVTVMVLLLILVYILYRRSEKNKKESKRKRKKRPTHHKK